MVVYSVYSRTRNNDNIRRPFTNQINIPTQTFHDLQ